MNYLETFKNNIKLSESDNDISCCQNLNCDDCPLLIKCTQLSSNVSLINFIIKRNQMILDYVNVQDNIERW